MPALPTSGPLKGIRILDLTWILSGPMCTQTLGDLGADVIKLERPPYGDVARTTMPMIDGESGYFFSINRGKRSIAVDLTTESGKTIFTDLIQEVDVVVENFTPGAMDRLGLGYTSLKDINPKLIYAAISGYGQTGPLKDKPALDVIVQGAGGVMSITGYQDSEPARVGFSVGDVAAGLYCAVGVLAAIHEREKSGEGQLIDMSQLESSVSGMAGALFAWDNGQVRYERLGNRVPYAAPHGAYLANEIGDRPDHWVAIACMTDFQWAALSTVMERPELAQDMRFATLQERKKNEIELDDIIGEWVSGFKAPDVMNKLQAASVPAGMVQKASEVLQDPHLAAREFYAYPDHSEAGKRAYDGPGFRLSETPHEIRGAAPLLGEHTWEICSEVLGMDSGEIGQLMAEQVLY